MQRKQLFAVQEDLSTRYLFSPSNLHVTKNMLTQNHFLYVFFNNNKHFMLNYIVYRLIINYFQYYY